jgi:hypothetical protein
MVRSFVLILLIASISYPVVAQDSLPKLSVKSKSGRVILSWQNPFNDVVQINIQRSYDSLKNFKTILSVADPSAVTNGYLDSKPPDIRQFYRLYVQQSGGKYFFTNSYRPVPDTARAVAKGRPGEKQSPKQRTTLPAGTRQTDGSMVLASEDEFLTESGAPKKIEKNSTARKKLSNTRQVGIDTTKVNAPDLQEISVPSVFVHTNNQGHVVVALPPEKTNQYTLKFFKDDGTPLFTMNKIRESQLTIDKTNFIKAGWFKFELYENNQLKEKNKFFIPRESF